MADSAVNLKTATTEQLLREIIFQTIEMEARQRLIQNTIDAVEERSGVTVGSVYVVDWTDSSGTKSCWVLSIVPRGDDSDGFSIKVAKARRL